MPGDRRRLAVCLFVAAVLHVVFIITIEMPELRIPAPPPGIDVVLRQESAPAPPPENAVIEPPGIIEVSAPDTDEAFPETPLAPPLEDIVPPQAPTEADVEAEHRPSVLAGASTPDLARAIAAQAHTLSTEVGTDGEGSHDAKPAPRVRRLSGPPRGDPELAYYLDSWRRKVQRVGNINYPSEARERGLSGNLRLLVVINPDGELEDVRVIDSSGHSTLDDGAMRIVNLAAPFSPFTSRMRDNFDLLEIERTWRFRNDRLTPMP